MKTGERRRGGAGGQATRKSTQGREEWELLVQAGKLQRQRWAPCRKMGFVGREHYECSLDGMVAQRGGLEILLRDRDSSVAGS